MAEFLSEDFMTEATTALNDSASFTAAMAGNDLSMQFHVTEAPEGQIDYYLDVAGGSAEMALGTRDGADVSVTNTYETALAVFNGELNTQMAFMSGKLKVAGNIAKLMMNQTLLNEFAATMSEIEVDG